MLTVGSVSYCAIMCHNIYMYIVYSECDVNPCNNSGICQYHAGSYMCTCLSEYSGPFCDIIFIDAPLPVPRESQALSAGAIVGIVIAIIGTIALIALIVLVTVYCRIHGDKSDDVDAKYRRVHGKRKYSHQ